MRFPPNPNLDWSNSPELLELEMLDYKEQADFDRLTQAIFAETDKELAKANLTRAALATDDELRPIIRAAVENYQPSFSRTLFIDVYLRVREFLWNKHQQPRI